MCSICWGNLILVVKLHFWHPFYTPARFVYSASLLHCKLHLRSWDHVVDRRRTHQSRLFLQLFGALKQLADKTGLLFLWVSVFPAKVNAMFFPWKLHHECVPKLVFLETVIVVVNIQLAANYIQGTIFGTCDPSLLVIVVGHIFVWKVNLFVLNRHAWSFGLRLDFWTPQRVELAW